MFKIALALAFVAVCYGFPAGDEPVPIVSFESAMEENGKFRYSYETADGTKAEEHGELKAAGDAGIEAVEGHFEFTAPDGEKFEVSYTADENGYQPHGAHIPTIPEAIARSLEWNLAHPEPEEKHINIKP